MKLFKLYVYTILLTATTSAYAAGYVKDGNNVTIQVGQPQTNGAKVVCLQVVNDNIIRVRATSDEQFPQKNSLIFVPQKASPNQSQQSAQGSSKWENIQKLPSARP